MRIGIIETGRPPEALDAQHGDYPSMFRNLLRSVDPDLEFLTRAALDGDVPEDPREADAWLITGSRHGVYERLDWIVALEGFVRSAVSANVPLVGICFGHQVIASALGGTVVQSDKGWGVGHHDYDVVDHRPWMTAKPKRLEINAVHQDQVIERPPGAEVLASSEFCENAALIYGDAILTMQPHPEFDDAFARDLIDQRLTGLVPDDRLDPARNTLGQPLSRDIAATWIVDFLRHARAAQDSAASPTKAVA
ncbi:MAG: type 1 glutamine amidotransferase [Pseudomonadota bacterium]